MDLYILSYNNYYNRILKKFDTLAEYLVTPYYNNKKVTNVSFNPSDGIETEQVVNFNPNSDYAILANGSTIVSRWFIVEAKRERTNQYTLKLRRDVLADSYDELLDSPMYIEKAMPKNGSAFIFNNENVSVNQIKDKEIFLKDKSGCQWIVGYIPKNTAAIASISISTPDVDVIDIGSTLENWIYYPYIETHNPEWGVYRAGLTDCKYGINYIDVIITKRIEYNKDGSFYGTELGQIGTSILKTSSIDHSKFNTKLNELGPQVVLDQAATAYNINTSSALNTLLAFNGKIIKTSDNKYYSVTVNSKVRETLEDRRVLTNTTLYSSLKSIATYMNCFSIAQDNNNNFEVTITYGNYSLTLKEETAISTAVSLPSTRSKCVDAMYDMFAIPYGLLDIKYNNETFQTTEDLANRTAIAISNSLVDDSSNALQIYDLQLLPYCPVEDMITSAGEMDLTNADTSRYSFITDGDGNKKGVVLFPSITKVLLEPIVVNLDINKYFHKSTEYWQSVNKKISNVCELYRLCSPNWASMYEFSVAKNDGVIYFDVDCTFKPYQPYIHINPQWSGLYVTKNQDFNDTRGLILNGDFSYGQISSAWQEYQLNNKNFQEIFDRDIKHMDISSATEFAKQQASGNALSAISFGFEHYATGASAGVDTAIKGAASAVSWKENRDYMTDKYNYNLQNIQAQPYSLTKVSAITTTYKGWPFIEVYTCTDEEKDALYNKFKYEGMNVSAIGKLSDYLSDDHRVYFKANPIKMEINNEDSHYVHELCNEVSKGFFIGEDEEGADLEQFSITTSLTNVYADSSNPTIIYELGSQTLKFTATSGYILPDSIVVTGASYDYDDDTGVVRIYNPTDDVNIQIIGSSLNTYSIYTTLTNITPNASNPSNIASGGTATLTFTADTYYTLPTTIIVTGATYTWDDSTGTLVLSNPTDDVNITIAGDPINKTLTVRYWNQASESIASNYTYTALEGTNVTLAELRAQREPITNYSYVGATPTTNPVVLDDDKTVTLNYSYDEPTTYTISYSSNLATHTPSSITAGGSVTCTITAYSGYKITAVIPTNGTITDRTGIGTNQVTFTLSGVSANTVINATTEAIVSSYTITYSGSNLYSYDPTTINSGASTTCTIDSYVGYKITAVSTSNGSITNLLGIGTDEVSFTLSGVSANTTITVTTEAVPTTYSINYSVDSGTITGTPSSYSVGTTSLTCSITCSNEIDSVNVTGATLVSWRLLTDYTASIQLSNPSGNISISVTTI